MLVAIKIRIGNQVAHAVPSLIVEQQATQNRLLGLDGMRRDTQLIEGGIRNSGFLRALVHGGKFKLKRPRNCEAFCRDA